jgi:hypothetical protein
MNKNEFGLRICFPQSMRLAIVDFIKSAMNEPRPVISKEFRNDYFNIYLRMCKPGYTYSCLELTGSLIVAKIDLTEHFRGQGIFSFVLSFLVEHNPYSTLCFEQVFGKKLEKILLKKGYSRQIEPPISNPMIAKIIGKRKPKDFRNWIKNYGH